MFLKNWNIGVPWTENYVYYLQYNSENKFSSKLPFNVAQETFLHSLSRVGLPPGPFLGSIQCDRTHWYRERCRWIMRGDASCVVMRQSQSQKFLLRKEIYIEHQNILIHGQDTKKMASGSRQGKLLLDLLT